MNKHLGDFVRIFLFVGLLLIITLASLLWWKNQLKAPNDDFPDEITLVIKPGDSASTVIDQLAGLRLIRSAFASKLLFKLFGSDNWILPGAYSLSPNHDVYQIFDQLRRGPRDVWVTFPEGWRREQIMARLSARLPGLDINTFDQISASLEGRLFPDTYLIPLHAGPEEIVNMFTANFSRRTDSVSGSEIDDRILIIASLIEREAAASADRFLVSGIIHKRLVRGWPLQIDATVQYALGSQQCSAATGDCNWWPPVSDTEIPSVYNTYLSSGLPPAPICNPGLAAIQAALAPADTPYWFYLTDSAGVTHYASTLTGHNLNIDKYLRH